MTVDTGATINVIDHRTFDQMTNINLQSTDVKACAYNTTTPVKFLGKFKAAIETKRRYEVATFYVVQHAKSTGGSLLSSNTAQELGLLFKVEFKGEKYLVFAVNHTVQNCLSLKIHQPKSSSV